MARGRASEVIAAPAERCFEEIADFDAYPEWQKAVKEAEVRERDGDGRGTLVAFRVDAKLREVRYTLRYHFDAPHRIWWDYVEGDAKNVEGEFRFEDLGDGTTRATYDIDVDAGGRLVPGKVKEALAQEATSSTVRALKRRVEG